MRFLRSFILISLVILGPASPGIPETTPDPLDGLDQGNYAVGFTLRHCLDYSRTFRAKFKAQGERVEAESARPVQLAVWYPAAGDSEKPHMIMADYFATTATEMDFAATDDVRIAAAEGIYREYMIGHVGAGYSEALWKRTRSEAVLASRDARPAPGRFPLILYAPGSPGTSFENYRLCEYLASHGYVVAGIPTTGDRTKAVRTNVRGIEAQTRDLEFALAEMRTYPGIDPGRIGAVGFSWGGLSNVPFAMRNGNVDALAVWDGAVTMAEYVQVFKTSPDYDPRRLNVPSLFILGARLDWNEADLEFIRALKYAPAIILRAVKLPHSQFRSLANKLNVYARTDLSPETVREYRISYETCCKYTRWFFDAALKNAPQVGAFLERAPEANGVPAGLFTIEKNNPLPAPPLDEDFIQWIRDQGTDRAEAFFRDARARDPEAVLFAEDLMSALGNEYLAKGKIGPAATVFRMNIAAYPGSADGYNGLAEALLKMGDAEGAIANFAEALRLDPENKPARDGMEKAKKRRPS